MTRRTLALLVATVAAVALAAATTATARTTDTTLNLVAYSVPRDALGAVIKAWQQTPDGKDVDFTQSRVKALVDALGQGPADHRRPGGAQDQLRRRRR